MNRSAFVLGASVAASLLSLAAFEGAAMACGGCFHPPTQTASDITDERMLLSVSTTQTTLYDQIRYSGSPASFAWVLPIKGSVDVGISADVLFASLDTVTTTTINPPEQPTCPAYPADCRQNTNSSFGASGAASPSADTGVTVTKQENVGPYATVQLAATDGDALNKWLTDNGYSIPDDVKPIVSQYVSEGFGFLAMKLLPNQGVQAMRPVRVTSPGAALSLPLRMAAIGTGASVGITIWVVADGRYEPQNFPFYHIEDKDLVWDWKVNSSNYTTLRAQNESNLAGKGWEMESSIALNQQLITNVIESGGYYYGGGGVGSAPVSDASTDYLPVSASQDQQAQTAEDVRQADIAALFVGMTGPNVRITRMRSDISHAAMTTDFILRASTDQSEIPNQRYVTQSVNPQCPIYNSCQVSGYGTPAQAQEAISNGSAVGSAGGCATVKKGNLSDLALAGLGGLGLMMLRRRSRRGSK